MKKVLVRKNRNEYCWKWKLDKIDKIDWFILIVYVLMLGFGIFQIVRGVKNV